MLNDKYFKTHRTHDILNEVKAQGLQEQSISSMAAQMTEEGRNEFFEKLRSRQPRRHPKVVIDEATKQRMDNWAKDFNG